MFSDALRILDENTTKYMVELQKQEIEEMKQQLAELKRESAAALEQKQQEITRLNALVDQLLSQQNTGN